MAHDRKVARFISAHLGVPRVATWLTMEGGGIEVNGRGLALVSESCVLNANRNPGKSKAQVEAEFARVFGVQHVLWVPGVRATDITDGHIDFYARFATDSEILYTWDGGLDEDDEASVDALNLEMLEAGAARIHALPKADRTRLLGRADARIRLTALASPDPERVRASVVKRTPALARRGYFQDESFAAGYVGYYEANGCVLMAQFGDPVADAAAFETIRERYPERTIVQMTTDGLANGGGTIHCATQQQIKA